MKKIYIDMSKYENCPPAQGRRVVKMKSNAYTIIKDQFDPNVSTINNIITGLSNSVNRLSALHSDLDSKHQQQCGVKKRSVREIACGGDDGTYNIRNLILRLGLDERTFFLSQTTKLWRNARLLLAVIMSKISNLRKLEGSTKQ